MTDLCTDIALGSMGFRELAHPTEARDLNTRPNVSCLKRVTQDCRYESFVPLFSPEFKYGAHQLDVVGMETQSRLPHTATNQPISLEFLVQLGCLLKNIGFESWIERTILNIFQPPRDDEIIRVAFVLLGNPLEHGRPDTDQQLSKAGGLGRFRSGTQEESLIPESVKRLGARIRACDRPRRPSSMTGNAQTSRTRSASAGYTVLELAPRRTQGIAEKVVGRK